VSTLEPRTDRAALSRDLTEFLVELSIALHKHSMYPEGHPALEPAILGVIRRAESLLTERALIAFGVARRQLIIEGHSTDPSHPLLRRLAESLHRHHLGAISVVRGLEVEELASALRALSADAEREGPIGLRREQLQAWPHFKLHPLTFDRLSLVGDPSPTDAAATGSGGGGGKAGSARAAELWIGLARAAMVSGEAGDSTPVSTDPSDVARAIDAQQGRADAYDQVIVGHLLQIAGELNSAPAAEVEALRKRTSLLIAALRPETLRRLVDMGGNAAQRGSFVLDATHGMDVEAVLQIVKAAADANGQVISNGLVRLMSKLAQQAGANNETASPLADTALRDQVTQLLTGWHLRDPNPERYSEVLERLAHQTSDTQLMVPHGTGDAPAGALRIIQIALECGVTGPLVERSIERLVACGHVSRILELLPVRPAGSDSVADAVVAHLVRPANLAALVEREPMDEASLDGLLPFMSAEGFQALLDVLATSENRATRRKLIDRLARAALDTGPYIAARLEDDRWYVLRNMLLLMERSGHVPEGFSATRWTAHPDPRVRYEALRLQLTISRERERAIRTALDDDDPRLVRLGLTALQQDCAPSYAATVAAIAANPRADAEARLLAVNALSRLGQPEALEAFLKILDGGRTFFRRPKLAPKSPVVLAALRAVAHSWSRDPRGADLLKRAQRSRDDDMRQAALGEHA
jgi:hypothetical protein